MKTSVQKSTSFYDSSSISLINIRSKAGHLCTEIASHSVAWLYNIPSSLRSFNSTTSIAYAAANITSFMATILLTGTISQWIDKNKKMSTNIKSKIKLIFDSCVVAFSSYSANALVSKNTKTPITQSRLFLISAGTLSFYLFLFWKNLSSLSHGLGGKRLKTKKNLDPNSSPLDFEQKKRKMDKSQNSSDLSDHNHKNCSDSNHIKKPFFENKKTNTDCEGKKEDFSLPNIQEITGRNFQLHLPINENDERITTCPRGSMHIVSPRPRPTINSLVKEKKEQIEKHQGKEDNSSN